MIETVLDEEERGTREDSATQPMDAGWLSFATIFTCRFKVVFTRDNCCTVDEFLEMMSDL